MLLTSELTALLCLIRKFVFNWEPLLWLSNNGGMEWNGKEKEMTSQTEPGTFQIPQTGVFSTQGQRLQS